MSKSKLKFVAIVLVAIVSASCASANLSGIQKKKTSDDCLVLIRTTLENNDGLPTAREYFFDFDKDYPRLKVKCEKKNGFISVLIRDADVKIVNVRSSIASNTNVTGNSSSTEYDLELPYKPGSVVVADFTFSLRLKRTSASEFYSWFDFPQISDTERAITLELFGKEKESAWWK